MALPMQQAAHAAHLAHAAHAATAPAQQAAPWPMPSNPTPRGGYAVAPSRGAEQGDPSSADDFYLQMEQVPPAALASPAPAPIGNGSEWTPAERIERPVIRPQSAGTAPLVRRAPAGQAPPQRPQDELGVEESEFDKPTYLRRGLYAPE
jgi:hypothetical protein